MEVEDAVKRCYFCQGRLGKRAKTDRHHIVPRRYFPPGVDPSYGNLAPAHTKCHRRFHDTLDRPGADWHGIVALMEPIDWGKGVFAR